MMIEKSSLCAKLAENRRWCKPVAEQQMKFPLELLAEIIVGGVVFPALKGLRVDANAFQIGWYRGYCSSQSCGSFFLEFLYQIGWYHDILSSLCRGVFLCPKNKNLGGCFHVSFTYYFVVVHFGFVWD